MALDWGLYVLGIVLTLGLGFLTYQDRLFGIAGIILGFLMDAFLFNQNSVSFNNSYSISGGTLLLPYVVIQSIIVVLDVAILLHVNAERKSLLNKGNEEG